jgi:hypothetical protein
MLGSVKRKEKAASHKATKSTKIYKEENGLSLRVPSYAWCLSAKKSFSEAREEKIILSQRHKDSQRKVVNLRIINQKVQNEISKNHIG